VTAFTIEDHRGFADLTGVSEIVPMHHAYGLKR
jgi:hypothetical protein